MALALNNPQRLICQSTKKKKNDLYEVLDFFFFFFPPPSPVIIRWWKPHHIRSDDRGIIHSRRKLILDDECFFLYSGSTCEPIRLRLLNIPTASLQRGNNPPVSVLYVTLNYWIVRIQSWNFIWSISSLFIVNVWSIFMINIHFVFVL